ncbi:MAG: tRNA (guanosine(46)-N7)-methyltransferase TrmB [Oscillospiraceae bacterium]|nr:tRNA (guanosine(46)-N7)-methyltransferase TrmB [Oscillospiraceae bacterium]
MRMRKKKNLSSRMDACGALLVQDPAAEKGRWRARKPDAVRLRLELGCGKGRFTAETAAAHPSDLYVAVERVPDAMVIAMERCQALGLTNVFFIDGDAAALEQYFAPGEVDLIYINFCDPWPSVKHSRRRLTHEGFLRGYRRVLREGGQVHFKTDNRALFEWSLFQFPKAGFTLSEVTRNLHEQGVQGVMTDYEEKFHALGTPINRCVGSMGPLPDVPLSDGLARRLPGWELRPVTGASVDAVLALLQSDPAYFDLERRQPTSQSLRDDIALLPPRCVPEQKRYLALWKDGAPQAVLDLVEGYPRERTLYVGFFFLSPALRRQGTGREIMDAVLQSAGDAGMDSARLACLLNNAAGHAFWRSLGFGDLRRSETIGDHSNPVWIMERLV